MAYCDASNVRVRLPALPRPGESAQIDIRIDESITSADAEIDARLRRFGASLPLNPVDPLIASISSALAAADVLDGGFSGGGEDEPTPLSARLRAWAERQLDLISSGDLILAGVNEELASGADGTVFVHAVHSHPCQEPELDCWDVMGPG